MKRKLIVAAVLSMVAAGSAFANPATVTFDSEVTANTCTLEAAQHNIISVIPDVTAKAVNAGVGAAVVIQSPDFALNFTGCPAGITSINVSDVQTSGAPSVSSMTKYAVPEGGSAKGVAVGTRLNGTVLAFGPNANPAVTAVVDGSGNASFTGSNTLVHDGAVAAKAGDYNTTFTLKFDWS